MWFTRLFHRLVEIVGGATRPVSRVRVVAPRGRRSPMKVVYTGAVVHEKVSLRSRAVQRGVRLVFKPLLHVAPVSDRMIMFLRRSETLSARSPRSKFVEPVSLDLGGVHVESMSHRYGPDSDMTILYLHGGGFFSGGIESHRRICERLARKTGATVISVDYVQLPEGTVADSVADVVTAYVALLDLTRHPDKVVVAGDSAGGYLAFKVAEIATLRGLQAPAALLGFSPLLSLDPERLDKNVERVVRARDAYLPPGKITKIRPRWLPEGVRIEGEESPLDAVEHISSPTFMVAVEDEILRPEVEAMALALSARGVEVETHLWRKQVHAFPVFGKALPESEMALDLASDFARRAVGELDHASVVDPDAHEDVLVGEVSPDSAA